MPDQRALGLAPADTARLAAPAPAAVPAEDGERPWRGIVLVALVMMIDIAIAVEGLGLYEYARWRGSDDGCTRDGCEKVLLVAPRAMLGGVGVLFAFTTLLNAFALCRGSRFNGQDVMSILSAVFDLLVVTLAAVFGVLVLTSFSAVQSWLHGAALTSVTPYNNTGEISLDLPGRDTLDRALWNGVSVSVIADITPGWTATFVFAVTFVHLLRASLWMKKLPEEWLHPPPPPPPPTSSSSSGESSSSDEESSLDDEPKNTAQRDDSGLLATVGPFLTLAAHADEPRNNSIGSYLLLVFIGAAVQQVGWWTLYHDIAMICAGIGGLIFLAGVLCFEARVDHSPNWSVGSLLGNGGGGTSDGFRTCLVIYSFFALLASQFAYDSCPATSAEETLPLETFEDYYERVGGAGGVGGTYRGYRAFCTNALEHEYNAKCGWSVRFDAEQVRTTFDATVLLLLDVAPLSHQFVRLLLDF